LTREDVGVIEVFEYNIPAAADPTSPSQLQRCFCVAADSVTSASQPVMWRLFLLRIAMSGTD
jgi:hypothetical protein